jgi:predicted DNA-binding transcriptional regulator AlpA
VDKLLTTAQVGRALGGRSADWVRRQIADGNFDQAVKDGGEWLIPEASVQAWITARTVQRTRTATAQVGNQVVAEIRRRRRERSHRQTA